MRWAAEALLLGLASGPACLASCGPVLVPWLAAGNTGPGGSSRMLAVFLSGRLAGYLLFAVLAWIAGLALPLQARPRALVFGVVQLGLAAALLWNARPRRQHCPAGCPHAAATASVGLLTGLNLCPPFVAAGIRAAESGSLVSAEAFFLCFFAGTAVWFFPLAVIGSLRRMGAVAGVARITMALLAAYYAYLGILSLSWRWMHA